MKHPRRHAKAEPHRYALHDLEKRGADLSGCIVELHPDGGVVLVVDGEQLFRFESFDSLLEHYELAKGAREKARERTPGEVTADRTELAAAEVAAGIAIRAIIAQPRAKKVLVDERVFDAIERLRRARERLPP